MTDRATPAALQEYAERMAAVFAERLGLGDGTQSTDEWPVEEGDAVLRANLVGEVTGTVVLAVNSDVATRLLAASDQLGGALAAAAAELGEGLGMTIETDAAQLGEPDCPDYIVAILDDGQLTALAGLTVQLPAELVEVDDGGDDEIVDDAVQFEPAAFGQDAWNPSGDGGPLRLLGGVEMLVTAELGRTRMPMRELLALTPGMVVEIDRAAGSPIDLLVNGRRIATGEVVVIDEEFGIRITEIVPAVEQV